MSLSSIRIKGPKTPSNNSIQNNLHNIIIGLSLGDLHISRDYKNTRLRLKQGAINSSYLEHL